MCLLDDMLTWKHSSSKYGSGPAAQASPENLVEMQNLRSYSRCAK